jgi:hypothetical protein
VSYAGPTGRLRGLGDLSRLRGQWWRAQPKLDGQYACAHTDAAGVVFAVTSRTGRELDSDLVGVRLDAPHAVIAGELTAHTEHGIAERARAGAEHLHAFDLLQLDGRCLASRPYQQRLDALQRARGLGLYRRDDRTWQDDDRGDAHDSGGRYTRRIRDGWGRVPVVPTLALSEAEGLLERAKSPDRGFVEGAVLVRLDAPAGARRAKVKLKPADGLDCVVISSTRKRAILHWLPMDLYFSTGSAGKLLSPGQLVEVQHEGFHGDGAPRFPRIYRVRSDL